MPRNLVVTVSGDAAVRQIKSVIVAAGLTQGKIIPPTHGAMWYTGSVHVGQPGVAVIAGHDFSYGDPGVFRHLGSVRAGDAVSFTFPGGAKQTFRVTSVYTPTKDELQRDTRVWGKSAKSGPPRVALIGCDPTAPTTIVDGGRHSTKNVVVLATLINPGG